MDATTFAAWLSLIGLFVGGAFTLFSKKLRAPSDRAAERRDTIADRDAWIKTLTDRLDDMDVRLEAAEREIREVRTVNEKLKAALYKVLAILRENNLLDRIRPGDIPDDIHY